MRRINIMGVACGAVLAMGAIGVSTAAAHPKILEIKEDGAKKSTGTAVLEQGEFFLTTTTGNFTCEDYSEGTLATNDAKTDTFTETSTHYKCNTGPVVFSDPGGVSAISVSSKGKATASVTIFVPWPAPNENCVYTGKTSKDNEVKGENTVTDALTVSELVKEVKLKGQGCPQKKAELTFVLYTFGVFALEAELH
jgi:hypothetical protein